MKINFSLLNKTYSPYNHNSSTSGVKNPYAPKMNCLDNDVFVKSSNTINFGYNFVLKQPRAIPCAYCGKEMLSKDSVYEIISLKGQKLSDRLDDFAMQGLSNMSVQSRLALYYVKCVALNNPEKTGKEILPIIYTRARNRMLLKQMDVYSRIEKLAQELKSDELLDYINEVKNQDAVLNPDISLDELSDFLVNKIHIQFRKDVIMNVTCIASNGMQNGNVDSWLKVVNEISKLPSSKTDPDAFLVKYVSKALRKDPKIENELISLNDDSAALFYSKILSPYVATAEHVQPHSDSGENDAINYLTVHSHCNMRRSSMPFSQYVLNRPEVLDNIIIYLKAIMVANLNNLNGFSKFNYITNISRKLKSQLNDVSDVPSVKKFLNELENISLMKPDTKLSEPDANVKKLLYERFNAKLTGIDLQVEQSLREKFADILVKYKNRELDMVLDKLLYSSFEDLKNARAEKFSKVLQHFDNSVEAPYVELVERLRDTDPILTLQSPLEGNLNAILSDSYIFNHKVLVSNALHFANDSALDCDEKNYIALLPKRLSIKRNSDLYCVKILLNARDANGHYNKSKIYRYLRTFDFNM